MTSYAVVVPTLVRDTLADCLAALAAATGPHPDAIVLVDDRRPGPGSGAGPLEHALSVLGDLRERTTVLTGGGHGPAAARNTGLPVVVNTSLNTAGRPMVDDPRDALECFGSAPVDLLAIGPFVVRRPRRTPRP